MERSVSENLRQWWGPGYTKAWTPLGFSQFTSDADGILSTKYNRQLQTILRNRAPLSLARYIDSYDVGVSVNASDALDDGPKSDTAGAGAVVSARKGPTTVTANFKFLDPSKAYGSGSLALSTELRNALRLSPLAYPWLGSAVRLNASLNCKDLDMTKTGAPKLHDLNLGVNFAHANFQHGHSIGASSSNFGRGDVSLYHNIAVGSEGAAIGAEVETSTGFDLRDYNLGAMYSRPGAFTMSLQTKDRLKRLLFSEAFNLGYGLRAASKISTLTDAPLDFVELETGLEYAVPKRTSNSLVKAKINNSGKVSLAVENNDLPWVNIGLSASANVNGDSPAAAKGPSFGLSLVFGERNKEGADDLTGNLSLPAAGGAPNVCLPDGTCPRCPVRH